MARNTNEGSGCADHTGYGPEDHYSAFRGRKICPLKGAPPIATHTFREVVEGTQGSKTTYSAKRIFETSG